MIIGMVRSVDGSAAWTCCGFPIIIVCIVITVSGSVGLFKVHFTVKPFSVKQETQMKAVMLQQQSEPGPFLSLPVPL